MRGVKILIISLTLIVFCPSLLFSASTLSGNVYDRQGVGLPDVDVELLDEFYRSFYNRRTKTDSLGRYVFTQLPDGRYYVRVYGYKYDLEDQTDMIEIYTQSLRGGEGTGSFTLDFYLRPRKGSLAELETSLIFAQEVPSEAEKRYKQALKAFEKRKIEEGINQLSEALKIFPDYFLALHRMGKELFFLKRYDLAVAYLFRAVQINPKSASSLYYLGYSLHMLGKDYNKSALVALNEAYLRAPSSIQVLYVLGKVEREMGNYQKAEEHLLKAKKLYGRISPEIQKELAQLYANDLKKYKEAADELELYLETAGLTDEEKAQGKKVVENLRKKAKAGKN